MFHRDLISPYRPAFCTAAVVCTTCCSADVRQVRVFLEYYVFATGCRFLSSRHSSTGGQHQSIVNIVTKRRLFVLFLFLFFLLFAPFPPYFPPLHQCMLFFCFFNTYAYFLTCHFSGGHPWQTVTAAASVAWVAACRALVETRRANAYMAQEGRRLADESVKRDSQVGFSAIQIGELAMSLMLICL